MGEGMAAEGTIAVAGAPARSQPPRRVLLFSGHMIDRPDRSVARFPPAMEALAGEAIGRMLDTLGAGAGDVGIFGGACGGDLLFAEAALARGVTLEMYLPFEEARFLQESVDFAGDRWHERYLSIRARCSLVAVAGCLAGPDESAYTRNNVRMLAAAGRWGASAVEFICLWDGRSGDGPGGTAHLMGEVRRQQGRCHWIDTNRLLTMMVTSPRGQERR